jgi:hypothetical protein
MVTEALSILLSTTNAKLQFSQFDQYIRCSAPLKHECLLNPRKTAAGLDNPQQNYNQFSLAWQSAFSSAQFGSTRPPQFVNLTSALNAHILTRIPQKRFAYISLYYARYLLAAGWSADHNEMSAFTGKWPDSKTTLHAEGSTNFT